ncbi:putative E3 ubiquitin-protein ligase LIN, partial [Tanacetum coccineum]
DGGGMNPKGLRKCITLGFMINYREVILRDDGCGMNPESLRKCMTLGYSTKKSHSFYKQEDMMCRNVIADMDKLAPVLEIFVEANDRDRFEIVQFHSELVKPNRRTFNNQIMHIIKDEGTFSIMHTLLTYLQTAATDQLHVVVGVLLQLDLLADSILFIYMEILH